jgi:hypothetical protein
MLPPWLLRTVGLDVSVEPYALRTPRRLKYLGRSEGRVEIIHINLFQGTLWRMR